MIDTYSRSADTDRATATLLHEARTRGFVPHHWHFGLFNVRDLMKGAGTLRELQPQDRTGDRRYAGVPYRVVSLDDIVQLCCRPAGNPFAPLTAFRWQAPD